MSTLPDGPDELLTVEEVGHLLKVRPSTVRRLVQRGQLPPPLRLNRRVLRWSSQELQRWIDQQGQTSRAQAS